MICSARVWRVVRFLLLAVLIGIAISACKREISVSIGTPPLPVVTDATTAMVLTWIDEKGEFHRESTVAAVPEAQREMVRVLDPDHEAPNDQIFVVDLRRAEGGSYPVHLAQRGEFEKIAAARRGDKAIANRPAVPFVDDQDPDAAVGPAPAKPVIIYGAEWCGPCHQVQAYLKRKNVPFVDKDIDNDPGAAKEMRAKLEKAGLRGGSIPVVDVHGKLLIGFDARAIDRALAN